MSDRFTVSLFALFKPKMAKLVYGGRVGALTASLRSLLQSIDVKNITLQLKNIKTCFFSFIKNIKKHA